MADQRDGKSSTNLCFNCLNTYAWINIIANFANPNRSGFPVVPLLQVQWFASNVTHRAVRPNLRLCSVAVGSNGIQRHLTHFEQIHIKLWHVTRFCQLYKQIWPYLTELVSWFCSSIGSNSTDLPVQPASRCHTGGIHPPTGRNQGETITPNPALGVTYH